MATFSPSNMFVQQFSDANGVPLSGGTLSAFRAGTTTPVTMYADSAGTEAGSTITLNARGEPEVSGNAIIVWLDASISYKFVLKDSEETTVWSIDNIKPNGGVSGGTTPPVIDSGIITAYAFNGFDMFATMPSYRTLGSIDIYRDIRYITSNYDNKIINETAEPITEFGRTGAGYHEGTIQYLAITDRSPIQNTFALVGNNSLYATLSPISITGDFEISFDYKRIDTLSGTIQQRLLSSNAGSYEVLSVYDSLYPSSPNSIQLNTTTFPATFVGVLSDVAAGQHISVRITRVGSVHNCYIDGVLKSTVTIASDAFAIDTLMISSNRTIGPLVTGAIMQNLNIINGASEWFYPMNEGTGTTLNNTDSGTGSAYDATLTAANWQWIPANSRLYEVNADTGSTLVDVVGGKDATIQNYSSGNWVSTPQDDTLLKAIWQKPSGQPVFIVLTGQSNAGAHNIAANPMPINNRIFDFATDGPTVPQSETPQWRVPQTTDPSGKDDFTSTLVYTGYRQRGRAYIIGACADRIQKITGRDVYMVQVFKGSSNITEWTNPGGFNELLATRVNEALNTPELIAAGITSPDAVIWMQGENNSGDSASDYLDAWNVFRTQTESAGWTIPGVTEFYIYDFANEWNWDWTTAYERPERSYNMRYLADNAAEPTTFVTSLGLPGEPGGEIHFTGDAANKYGQRFADFILFDS